YVAGLQGNVHVAVVILGRLAAAGAAGRDTFLNHAYYLVDIAPDLNRLVKRIFEREQLVGHPGANHADVEHVMVVISGQEATGRQLELVDFLVLRGGADHSADVFSAQVLDLLLVNAHRHVANHGGNAAEAFVVRPGQPVNWNARRWSAARRGI